MKIKLNNTTSLDLSKLLRTKLLVQANSGGGKSWLLRRILEQSHGSVQQIILDPEGEFGTLREKYDYILAGKDADTPAEPRSAALLAHKLLELGVSAIIDLYELHPQERKHFVRLFMDAMVNAPKNLWRDVLVVLDEAHVFVPEKGESEASSAVIGMASLGRKRGFGLILATQRISKLHKDAAAECNNKLIGRTGLDIDRKRAGEELGFTTKEEFLSLRSLQPGEFFSFGPAISDEVMRLKIGDVSTTHPEAGSRSFGKVVPPTDRIKKVLGKLGDLPKEAEKELHTISEFKKENSELKRKLANANRLSTKENPAVKVERIEVPMVGKRTLEGLKKAEQSMKRILAATRDAYMRTGEHIVLVEKHVAKFATILDILPKRDAVVPPTPIKLSLDLLSTRQAQKVHSNPATTLDGEFKPSRSQQAILNALAWLETIGVTEADKSQVALLSDQSPTSGGYFNNLSSLRTAGLIIYPRPSVLSLTEAGRVLSRVEKVPSTSQDLHDQIFRKLSDSQTSIMKVLIEIYPQQISKMELAQRVGQSGTSGGYFNNLGRLRTLKLLDYPVPGTVVAEKILFL